MLSLIFPGFLHYGKTRQELPVLQDHASPGADVTCSPEVIHSKLSKKYNSTCHHRVCIFSKK